jgi:TonB family protein
MNKQLKSWEGQTVDGKFLLRRLLASTDHSVVFLTQLDGQQPSDAVLKFISADTPGADACLSLWQRATQLSHANLIAIYDSGRCSFDGRNLLYVVMEYAEENLGEILPQRPLSADEMRDVLDPVLQVLAYLHSKGLAHGHLKPSNLLATRDCLKLSSDTLLNLNEPPVLFRSRDIYDAPELPSTAPTPASDVWSLGATLAETLTQRPPLLHGNPDADPVFSGDMPELFANIARHALVRHPDERWTVAEIAARLSPAPLAAAAAAAFTASVSSAASLSIPAPSETSVPLRKLQPVAESPARSPMDTSKRKPSSPFDYFIPVLLGAAVFFGLILALPKILDFRHSPSPQVAASPEPRTVSQPATTAEASDLPPASAATPAAPDRKANPLPASAPIAPAVLHADSSDSGAARPAPEKEGQSEVLDQVLPRAASKALATIQGTVRVVVKVQVDASGNVTAANLQTPGPSRYFADLAEKAARQWKFSGAEAQGRAVPSTWQIRFDYMNSGVRAYPQQITP